MNVLLLISRFLWRYATTYTGADFTFCLHEKTYICGKTEFEELTIRSSSSNENLLTKLKVYLKICTYVTIKQRVLKQR